MVIDIDELTAALLIQCLIRRTVHTSNMATNSEVRQDYQFSIEPDDGLKCLICLEVASDPWQHGKCGRLFCKECLDKNGMGKPCPNCRRENPQYFEDSKSRRDIRALGVKCDNVERGCQWVGTVDTLEKHVGGCDFILVPCSNKCKDDKGILMIMRRDLQQHLLKTCPNRDYSCEHCGLKGTYVTTQDHYPTCEKMIVTCTNEECDMRMERMKIKNHLANDCEHNVITCKYMSIGCDVKSKRKDMRAHEQDHDEVHLKLAMDTVLHLKKMDTLRIGESVTFKLKEFQRRKEMDDVFTSLSFYTSPNGYHMSIRVYANGYGEGKGSHVSVFARILEGRHDDDLSWPLEGVVIFELLNQLEDKDHHDFECKVLSRFKIQSVSRRSKMTLREKNASGLSRGKANFIPHSQLSNDSTQYLKDDSLYFRVTANFPIQKSWLECTL